MAVNEQNRRRVAIGAFDRFANLEQALGEITTLGVPCSRLVLLAAADALDGQVHNHRIGVASYSESVLAVVDGGSCADEPAADASPPLSDEQQRMVSFDTWVGPRIAAGLRQLMTGGACLLFAMVGPLGEEVDVARVLLKYAVGQVQVHDFRV